ncbi:Cof-type HAD-IIB family hydrolase [Fusobacterium varium]|uniref:Cof-type HAD-IIB family hydrolase n=1 Tax=Fusobacterium varium TaxID=856 RepID=UPI002FF138B3
MKYKAIVCDLDGTLLNSQHTISKYTRDVIKNVTNLGVKFFIATGRHHMDALKFKEMLGLDSYLISSNGARIHNENNEIIFKGDIPKELSNEIFDLNINEEIYKNIYKDDFWFSEKPLDEAHEYHKESGFTYSVRKFSELKNSEVIKFFYINEDEKLIRNLENEINEKFGNRINLTLSLPICLEIMNKGISKGNAIKDILLPKFKITPEEVISFGDGLNDYEMLDIVGEGLLMGNCNPRLKELLPNNKVIGRNDEDGVAEYLKKVFL